MGILRFLLALAVIGWHSFGIGISVSDAKPYTTWYLNLIDGIQAVTIFYIISGFYMAMVLNTKYSKQTLAFYINRFLRLWPTYIVVFVLACIFTPAGSTIATALLGCGLFIKTYVWFCNIFILGTDSLLLLSIDNCKLHYLPMFIHQNANGDKFLVNLPAFTIGIEMIFYLMAPFILKSLKRTWIYFALGVIYCFYVVLSENVNIVYQYHLFPSSFIYFGLGGLSWHYAQKLNFELTEKNVLFIFIACLLLMFLNTLFPMLIVLGFALLIPRLFEITKKSKTDRMIGEMSYSLYIVHYPVLAYLSSLSVSHERLGLLCLTISLLFSVVIHFLVEKPIDRWRQNNIPSK